MTYYEATLGSLVLRPTALHLSFKVPSAYESLHTLDLLLDFRMDNCSQGTFTPYVPRLYRRAIGKANQKASPPQPWLDLLLEPRIQDMMEEYLSQHG
jgi:hypothetical protein